MEGVNWVPETDADDDEESKAEVKDKKKDDGKKPSLFEKLLKGDEDEEKPKKGFDFFKDDKAEKEDAETETPLEKLAEDEKQTAAEKYVEARTGEVKQELTEVPDDSPAETAVLANAALLENIQEKLEADEPIDEKLLDEAVAETLEELGLEDEPTAAEETVEEPEDVDEDDTAVAPTPISSQSTPVPPPPIRPPTPPVPPTHPIPGPPPPPGPPLPIPTTRPAMPGNLAPTPNVAPAEVVTVRNRRREAANLLVGGIVGYMIGRRGGRLRTEAKLLPVQEKLKKEVSNLHDLIALREEKIRKLTYEQTVEQPIKQQKVIEQVEKRAEQKIASGAPVKPEKLGKFAVLAERPVPKPEAQKPVGLMTVAELLVIASRIEAGQSNVKQLYETQRLNNDGLRSVVEAYLRGERIEPILKARINTPEILRTPEHLPEDKNPEIAEKPAPKSGVNDLLAQHVVPPEQYQPYRLPPSYQTNSQFQPHTKKPFNKKPITAAVITAIAITLLVLLLVAR